MLKSLVRGLIYRLGFDVIRLKYSVDKRRLRMLNHNNISLVLDVGANTGGYATTVRRSGYSGRILSFEPVSRTFADLEAQANSDYRWDVFQCAVGDTQGELEINVSGRSASSSLLPMLDRHIISAPGSGYVRREPVRVRTLDEAVTPLLAPEDRILLKIDTQGYEHNVLAGARGILNQVALIECELSLVSLYEGQKLYDEMLQLLRSLGFHPVLLSPGFWDSSSGYCLQVESIFARS